MSFYQWDRKAYPEEIHIGNAILKGIERGHRHAGWDAGQRELRRKYYRLTRAALTVLSHMDDDPNDCEFCRELRDALAVLGKQVKPSSEVRDEPSL